MLHSLRTSHPRLFKCALAMVALGLFLSGSELLFRVVRYGVKGSEASRALIEGDDELGWRLNTARGEISKLNKCGEEVLTPRYSDSYLVKTPAQVGELRVLFLGDSFTHAHEVSTGRAYYDRFEERADGEFAVFAAGVGGFSNLQEYLLLARVQDEVKADIVIWQLSGNDVVDNVFALDDGHLYNMQRPRPYLDLETGSIQVLNPGFFLLDVSQLFKFLFHRMIAVDASHDLGLLEAAQSFIQPSEEQLPELRRQGIQVLGEVLTRAMEEYPGTRFFGFSSTEGYEEEYRNVFESRGAGYFPEVFRRVSEHSGTTDCAPLDDHWNHLGNEVAGDVLLDALQVALRSGGGSPH